MGEASEEYKKEPEPEKEQRVDLSVDYYKVLGVQPGPATTVDSITRAFKHKGNVHDPSRVSFCRSRDPIFDEHDQRKPATIQDAYAILMNYELRKQYDSGRSVPLSDRRPGGRGKRVPANRRRK